MVGLCEGGNEPPGSLKASKCDGGFMSLTSFLMARCAPPNVTSVHLNTRRRVGTAVIILCPQRLYQGQCRHLFFGKNQYFRVCAHLPNYEVLHKCRQYKTTEFYLHVSIRLQSVTPSESMIRSVGSDELSAAIEFRVCYENAALQTAELGLILREPGGSLPPSHKSAIGPYPEQD
ncbi:hypothetical protein ANN_15139 [Periplaneta americana]|uniref:Uncharacterized protein n=1 Tax=Periplaneta americana TaxID=6978 RepID=A0ABQ8SY86_PERAM|nr:hypothetical protein ANN_15139 [Periplaneta americana]